MSLLFVVVPQKSPTPQAWGVYLKASSEVYGVDFMVQQILWSNTSQALLDHKIYTINL